MFIIGFFKTQNFNQGKGGVLQGRKARRFLLNSHFLGMFNTNILGSVISFYRTPKVVWFKTGKTSPSTCKKVKIKFKGW